MTKLVMKKFIIPKVLKGTVAPEPDAGGTPDNIRQALSKMALLESGGKRVSVNLSGKAVKDLERVKHRDGTDNTQSIIAALAAFAKR